MYKSGKAIRNRDGKIVGGYLMMRNRVGDKEKPAAARIAPNRKWFGNTRVVGPEELDRFREEMGKRVADPYSVVLQTKKLPMALLTEPATAPSMKLLSAQSFGETFGPNARRKRPNLGESVSNLHTLVQRVETVSEEYDQKKDAAAAAAYLEATGVELPTSDAAAVAEAESMSNAVGEQAANREFVFGAGQSRRIWNELYKVLDCSDVVIQVLDARNPAGTRCKRVEEHLKKNARHKHLIFVLNKCDLVPPWVTRKWVAILSQEYPTLAFHASITKSFGKGSLISLLRQFAKLHSDKQQISVGLIGKWACIPVGRRCAGYPNVGKSSIINTLKQKKVCKVAPIPGEPKVWQYVTLMKRVFLIDCPGVVVPSGDSEADLVLKGVVRAERLSAPQDYVGPLLQRVQRSYLVKTYGVEEWSSAENFLEQVARKAGKLAKGNQADLVVAARMIINDLQRGK
ncbi:Gnl2, partial [Symbiodinium sp. KB8]